jgi:Uma2 family endonuclease
MRPYGNEDDGAIIVFENATVEDLARVEGKAELVGGMLVREPPTGFLPGHASGEVFVHLREYANRTRTGFAFGDGAGFLVELPNRQSFCPDAAFYTGEPTGMQFLQGAPLFAVEIRSTNDYGAAAEERMARKRADYFAAGTRVVWDVDMLSVDVVRSYRAEDPARPLIFRRGDHAHAEPAVPGWSMPVDDLFPRYTRTEPA